jgi:hypothetical protein
MAAQAAIHASLPSATTEVMRTSRLLCPDFTSPSSKAGVDGRLRGHDD